VEDAGQFGRCMVAGWASRPIPHELVPSTFIMPSAQVETIVQVAPPIITSSIDHRVIQKPVKSRPVRKALNAVVMRAGTSKGLFLKLEDLPARREDWTPIILAAMGSPDPYMKQLDGMGGGVSTQSKIAVVSRSDDPRADVDYLFIQGALEGHRATSLLWWYLYSRVSSAQCLLTR
jgi:hypothetical protein